MTPPKRFSYITSDGKRHWVKIQRFLMPEGVEFAVADETSVCHNRKELQIPKGIPARSVTATARDLSLPDVCRPDK